MYNSLWKKILDVYLGTPFKALIFALFFVIQFFIFGRYFYQSRIDIYEMRLEQLQQEQILLEKMVAEIREKKPLSVSFSFKKLVFNESIEKEKESQVRRLLEYGRFALTKNDYDYAKSLFQEANSITETKEAQYYLGIIAFQTGKYKEAKASFDKITIHADDINYNDLKLYSLMAAYQLGQAD